MSQHLVTYHSTLHLQYHRLAQVCTAGKQQGSHIIIITKLTPSLPYMTEISVGFTIVIPGSLDHSMHFGLEVKRLKDFSKNKVHFIARPIQKAKTALYPYTTNLFYLLLTLVLLDPDIYGFKHILSQIICH